MHMFENIIEYEKNVLFKKDTIDVIPPKKMTSEEINTKYTKGDIRIVTEQARYPLPTIKDMINSPDYIIHPEYQRRHRWNREKQSLLIESLIMNVPIPPIFLYEVEFSCYEVMDGLQRLTAIKEFYCNEYPLEGLEEWPELNGMRYSELPTQIRKGIDRRYISSIILLKETAKSKEEATSLKQMVFSRINSGGAKLEDQEFRNAQYKSEFNEMIMRVARTDVFCQIFDIPFKTDDENLNKNIISSELRENKMFRTMKDVETVLRFFAIRSNILWGNNLSLKKYLDRFEELMGNTPKEIVNEYEELYKETISFAYDLYNENTFCIYKKNKNSEDYFWSKRPVLFVYDCVMTSLSKIINKKNIIIEKRLEIIEDTKKLFINNEDMINGRNTTKKNIQDRIKQFDLLFSKYYD